MNSDEVWVDPAALRSEVRELYRDVAEDPTGDFHFHTGRQQAERCGYDLARVDELPPAAVEAFAGVGNPLALRALEAGEEVLDVGSGAGLDSFLAGKAVGSGGHVVGVDMTPGMVERARRVGKEIGATNVEFREGICEDLPVEDGSVDVVIANGALNLVADKQQAFVEIWRVLRAGGVLQFADIANGRPVPEGAMRDIDLWAA